MESQEAPPNSTVFLTSHRHHDKLLEVNVTSCGGLASRPSGHVAHTHALALGLGGPHKVLAPVLGAAPEPLLDLRGLGEGGIKKVEGAGVRARGATEPICSGRLNICSLLP